MWFVYILQSLKDFGYYTGYTSSTTKRVEMHNAGANRATRNRRPLKLIYCEKYNTKRGAIIRERQIKSWKGGDEFKKLLRKK